MIAPTPADLAGRLAVARAAIREHTGQADSGGPVNYQEQARMLAAALSGLLTALDGLSSHTGPPGMAFVAAGDVALVLGALADGAAWRERFCDAATATEYAQLAAALGAAQ